MHKTHLVGARTHNLQSLSVDLTEGKHKTLMSGEFFMRRS
jgi:hypothetical protein